MVGIALGAMALGILAGCLAGAVSADVFSKRTRRAKRQAVAAAQWMDRVHKRCIEARDVEPFAGYIADEIVKHLTKD
jgi:Na+/glutamate symporter